MNVREKRCKINIVCMYGTTFFKNLIFAYVIERLFSLSRGLDLEMLAVLETVYCGMVILFEVPSGYLADVWSRKNLLVISSVLVCCEFLITIFAWNFYMFLFATIVAGIAGAFTSGADNALLYDSLKELGKEEKFKEHLSRLRVVDYTSGIIAALVGAQIAYKANYTTNYVMSLTSCIVVFIFTLCLIDTEKIKGKKFSYIIKSSRIDATRSLKDFKLVGEFFMKSPGIKYVVLCGVAVTSVVVMIDEYYQIILKDIGIPVYYFGIVGVVTLVGCSIGAHLSIRCEKVFRDIRVYKFVLIGMVLSLCGMGISRSIIVIVPLFLFYGFQAVLEPLIIGKIHKHAQDELRATTESFYSLLVRLGTVIIVFPFAILSQRIDMRAGIFFLVFIISALIIKGRGITIGKEQSEKTESC